jgi:tetratricopeptide (TPR) repeat protein
MSPHDAGLWQDWAQMLYRDGNVFGAITYLEEGIKINPSQVDLYYQCAAYCLGHKNRDKGLLFLENALILDAKKHFLMFHIQAELQQDPEVVNLIDLYS